MSPALFILSVIIAAVGLIDFIENYVSYLIL